MPLRSSMVLMNGGNYLFSDGEGTQRVFEPTVGGAAEDEVGLAQLVNFSQALERRVVYDCDFVVRQADEPVDWDEELVIRRPGAVVLLASQFVLGRGHYRIDTHRAAGAPPQKWQAAVRPLLRHVFSIHDGSRIVPGASGPESPVRLASPAGQLLKGSRAGSRAMVDRA